MRSMIVAVAGLVLAAPAGLRTADQAPAHSVIWVLEPPDQLAQYEAATFVRTTRITVPAAVFRDQVPLIVNALGQVLLRLDDRTAWTWNGETARTWNSGLVTPDPETHPPSVTEIGPQWFLGADGSHLWAAANVFTTVLGESGDERSRTGRFELWVSDLAGAGRRTVLTAPLPECTCQTGTCSETCLEARAWAPDEVIDSFFFLTRWIPGQLGPSFEDSSLYRERGGLWRATTLDEPVEAFQDAARHGEVWIETVPDVGCCGWINGSDDLTVLVRGATRVTVFDEFRRYGNADYDLSFYTATARFAPDGRRVAFDVHADAPPASDLRLSADGHENARELEAIRRALPDLPEVDIVSPDRPDALELRIPHAELIGWLSDAEILILDRGLLVAVNADSGSRRETGIGAARAGDVRITGAGR